jgi:excisionase family DNA binding protein
MKACSSREAARRLGISLMTLQRYIAAKKISAPRVQSLGEVRVRLWTARDLERVKRQIEKSKK